MEDNIEKIDTIPAYKPIYDPEKIKSFSGVSDQQLEYYRNNNIWSQDRIKWMIDFLKAKDKDVPSLIKQDTLAQIRNSKERTYSSNPHPLFRRIHNQDYDNRLTTSSTIDKVHSVNSVKGYLDEKHNPTSLEHLKKLVKEGETPYGHGSGMFKASSVADGGLDLEIIENDVLAHSPSLLFLKYPLSFIGSTGSHKIMSKIDNGELSFPEFESAWILSVENYMKLIPRLVTLLSRDSEWDIREMDIYINSKNIPNLDKSVALLGVTDSIGSMLELMNDYKIEDKQKITEFIKTWSDVYSAMVEYLENKVTYNV